MSFFKKMLIGSLVFCVVAVGLGAYLFFNGANLISADNIDIQINGPVSIPGGTPVSFDITVINKNNVDLQTADLAVDFPSGTTDPGNSTTELKTFRELIGDIPAGATAHKTVSAIMFGEENTQKTIVATVSYKVKGSTSLFKKDKTYDVLINSSPISVTVDSFDEITSGQEYDMKLNLKSNSQETLKNIIIKAQYPFGYAYLSSNIKPISDNATWVIGDIPPGATRTITIHGKLTGEDSDSRVFRFAVGSQSANDAKTIGTQYVVAEQDITVQKPFISLAMSINGDNNVGSGQPATNAFVGQYGQSANVEINWSNNLPVSVSNLVITVKLSGTAYDKSSVQPNQGFFQSSTDQVIFNQQTNPELASIGAGESGTVSFSIIPKDLGSSVRPVVNPLISLSASVTGDRTQETNVSSGLIAAVTRTIKVASNVSLSGRVLRTTGSFPNTGPIPPKADKASTYTIVWDIDNTSNAAGNAQVTATLPPYVKWLNVFNPGTENITYDSNSGKITWVAGAVGAYTLNTQQRKEVSFQVSATPPVTQVGQAMTLVNEATLTAVDAFTNITLSSRQESLTSRFSTDPGYHDGDGTVGK